MIAQSTTTNARRLRLAALLVAIGLLIQAASLFWTGPSAFLVFILLGAAAAGVGMILAASVILKRPRGVRTGA